MAKTIILGKTPYRVLKRSGLSISLQPVGTEYPHTLLLRDPPYKTKEPPARPRWGHSHRDRNEITWYRQLSDDVFEKIDYDTPKPKAAHATRSTKTARKLSHPDRIELDGEIVTVTSDRAVPLRGDLVRVTIQTRYGGWDQVELPAERVFILH